MLGTDAACSADEVIAVLAQRYGTIARAVDRVLLGQSTTNYRVSTTDRRRIFVTCYPGHADLAREERAIASSELAARHGVPVAPVIRNVDGALLDTAAGLSVWRWIPGSVAPLLGSRRLTEAGSALGRIHAAFAALPGSSEPSPHTDAWFRIDPGALRARIDTLLARISARTGSGERDGFDDAAERTLVERRAMLDHLPALLDGLPAGLSTQVVHGDFSPVNLLFDGDRLTAVLDFGPPEPFLPAYDLGRMAFYPHQVGPGRDWPGSARTFVTAYLRTNPAVRDADVAACARVALVQLLTSLYGVTQHYLGPAAFQPDLDRFWLARHVAAGTLLDHLDDTERLLGDVLADRPRVSM
ncbi:phosphotransferase enzyme family protein [Pseudonocardia sp. HH130630-07]|uniref:phosphotransferase enzyme family protein n=1 Tax=Pseudonocardia sp. HH130630-07 TaxID=1690815 RepID=UPI00081538B3|nr:phosphotransferase [Pseudonocardia sp. HH130630-07]ANY08739.1 hypothetical protein AFB00_23485 [Pseudonocardia sp. HH130630-07]